MLGVLHAKPSEGQGRKRFFFEKKNQKTFVLEAVARVLVPPSPSLPK
jgi:hypothetical protein